MFPNNAGFPMGPQSPFPIFQGGSITLAVRLLGVTNGLVGPFDLTSATAITCCFYNEDGTELALSLTSGITVFGNPLLGNINIELSAAQTALLAPILGATLEVTMTIAGEPVKCQIPNAYTIIETVC